MSGLVQPLFDGPLDVVGDVHGEIGPLESLLHHLGHAGVRRHRQGRRLVFLGDLTDRGPDSPAVVQLVQQAVTHGLAHCVLGNHELNILLGHRKAENGWFFGEETSHGGPERPADHAARGEIRGFFSSLPLALVRPDLRVVHACWDPAMIQLAAASADAAALYQSHHERIEADLCLRASLDLIDRDLVHQNENPVKLLTSGPEVRTDAPHLAGGRLRHERRVAWWDSYAHGPPCLFGHYSRLDGPHVAASFAFCVDFGVGKRWTERRAGTTNRFTHRLAALRIPEWTLVFDNGEVRPLEAPTRASA
jgi:hypothetical protein